MAGILQLVQVTAQPVRIRSLLVKSSDPFMLVNPDTVNPVFIGNDQASQPIPVPALGSITLADAEHDVWVSTSGGAYTVSAYLLPGGTNWVPSPAQVAAQISALGLAKDTSVQAVNGTLGTPAQQAGLTTINATLGTPAQNAAVQQLGGTAGRSVAQDMKAANQGVSTEVAALIATGTAGGSPGGVPVLRGTANLGSATAQTVAAAATATLLSTVSVAKPGFEAIIQLRLPSAAGTVPFAVLSVGWTDSNTGLQVGFKQYLMTAGNGPGNDLTYYLSGPCRGNQVTLTLQNLDPAQTMTFTWALNVTGHIYAIDRYLQPSYPSVNPIGFSTPGGNPAKGALFLSQPTIGPSGNITRLAACCNAKAKLSIDNGAQANGCAVTLADPGSLYNGGTSGQTLYRQAVAAGGQTIAEIQFPNGPLLVTMINQGATGNISPSIAITAMEY